MRLLSLNGKKLKQGIVVAETEKWVCDACGKLDMEELWSLSSYGENAYGVDTYGEEYCEKCFKEIIEDK